MSTEEILAALETADRSEKILEIVAFALSFIFLLIYVVFFCTLRKPTYNGKKIVVNRWTMILPTAYITLYTIRYLLRIISTARDYKDIYYRIIFDGCFAVCHSLFYIIMILRLALGFKGTQYELSRVKVIICYIIIICLFCINTLYYAIKRNGFGDDSVFRGSSLELFNNWNEDEIHKDLFIALVCSNLLFAVVLIYLFVRNIVLMILYQMEYKTRKDVLSRSQTNWLSVAIKYALLCGSAIILTNVQFSLWILFNLGIFDDNPVGGITFAMYNDWFWIAVLVNNYCCILLTFPAQAKHVYDTACASCHGCCQSIVRFCIFKCVDKKERKLTQRTIELQNTANNLQAMVIVPSTPNTPIEKQKGNQNTRKFRLASKSNADA